MQLIGQVNNLDMINRWDKLPNFVIIQGDEHTGKKYMVTYLCNKFKLHYVPIKNSVKEVRSLIDIMVPDSNTVYHFKNFDKASIQAKNALLKITEEPVPGNYIVITGGPQIKTLESRARRILMEPYTLSEMKSYMRPFFPEESDQVKLYNAGINTPAKVNFYKKYEHIQQLLDYAYEVFGKLTYLSPNTYIPMLKMFEDKYDNDKTDACLLFINMLINIIESNIKDKHYYSYKPMLSVLLNGKKALLREPTLRRKMLLFRMFYTISMKGAKNESS